MGVLLPKVGCSSSASNSSKFDVSSTPVIVGTYGGCSERITAEDVVRTWVFGRVDLLFTGENEKKTRCNRLNRACLFILSQLLVYCYLCSSEQLHINIGQHLSKLLSFELVLDTELLSIFVKLITQLIS